jgi:hypothetical protein
VPCSGLHRSPILYMKRSIFVITKEMVGYSIYTDRFTLPTIMIMLFNYVHSALSNLSKASSTLGTK